MGCRTRRITESDTDKTKAVCSVFEEIQFNYCVTVISVTGMY